MIKHTQIRKAIADGLSEYLGVPVIMANQTAPIPEHPYVSFTVTTPSISDNGTYARFDDGYDRKRAGQIWSITAQALESDMAAEIASKAYDYFDSIGRQHLKNNEIVVVSIGNTSNRDTLLTTMYEYRCGFDVTFAVLDEIDRTELDEGEIISAGITIKD